MNDFSISVIGLGYIGLPTAAILASRGQKVLGVDVNKFAIDTINAGKIHIVEPGLEKIVSDAVATGLLRASSLTETSDVFVIAVPTPFYPEEGTGGIPNPDLSYIKAASEGIATVLKKGDLVILESTSPVGTTEQLVAWMAERRTDITFPHTHGENSDIRIAYCPERVIPGQVIRELVENDRIIGGMSDACSKAASDFYKIFVKGKCAVTTTRTAEMAKLTENASRDVSIAFANELSVICDKLDISVWELIELANLHPRVNILQPGPGVGGHCIAVDPWFIVSQNPSDSRMIHQARLVNDSKPSWVVGKVTSAIDTILEQGFKKDHESVSIAFFGLAFKPDVDDLRGSPAIQIVETILQMEKYEVLAVEPNISELPDTLLGAQLVTVSKALLSADVVVLLVDHTEFKHVKPRENVAIVDTRGVWS